jgi:hypothetical protein
MSTGCHVYLDICYMDVLRYEMCSFLTFCKSRHLQSGHTVLFVMFFISFILLMNTMWHYVFL